MTRMQYQVSPRGGVQEKHEISGLAEVNNIIGGFKALFIVKPSPFCHLYLLKSSCSFVTG